MKWKDGGYSITKDEVSGYFTVGKVENGVVVKRVQCKSLDEKIILYEVFEWSKEKVENYYNILKKANVRTSMLKILCKGNESPPLLILSSKVECLRGSYLPV